MNASNNNDFFSKFNDFSRYKNNELKSYFTKIELDYYNSLREKSKIKTDSYIVSAFTFIVSTILKFNSLGVSLKEEPKNSIDKVFYFFKNIDVNSIISALLIGLIYYVLFRIIVPLLVYFTSIIKKKIMGLKIIGNIFNNMRSFNTKELKKISNEEHKDKFNNEVVNQLSLALSVLSHVENDKNNNTEKLFYLDECSEYLKKSLNCHYGILLYPKVVKTIQERGQFFIDKERIKTVLKVSSDIIERVEKQNINISSTKIHSDMIFCNERIRLIERELGELLNETP